METNVSVYGWPSRGGVIVLDDATNVDFKFLGLSSTNPPRKRDLSVIGSASRIEPKEQQDYEKPTGPGQEADSAMYEENHLCQRLLLLGAKWWDSERRYQSVIGFAENIESFVDRMEEGIEEEPTPRERRWVKVGWGRPFSYASSIEESDGKVRPADSQEGGFWILDCDNDWTDILEYDDLAPNDAGKVKLARTMDERCQILKRMGAKYYANLQCYKAESTFLRAWEWKREGEVGALEKASI